MFQQKLLFAFLFWRWVSTFISLAVTHNSSLAHKSCCPCQLFQKALLPSYPCWNQTPSIPTPEADVLDTCHFTDPINRGFTSPAAPGKQGGHWAMLGGQTKKTAQELTYFWEKHCRFPAPQEQLLLRDLFTCHREQGSPSLTSSFQVNIWNNCCSFHQSGQQEKYSGGGNHTPEQP